MSGTVASESSARLVLLSGVSLLHPEEAVFEAMLEGWERQQRGGRQLQPDTVRGRLNLIRRFGKFTNRYPWQWAAADVDEWMTHLTSELHRAESTIRGYQTGLRLFCDYITSPHYQWPAECESRFGTHPVQVCHEWNTVSHLVDYEGDPDRRPMTREEIQLFFDYADDQVDRAIRLGRKGALAAYRDATVFKAIYGWGLRCTETSKLDITDFYRSPKAPELGRYGSLHVRYGKRSKGTPPKRRMVLSVMPWAVDAVEDYVVNIRSRYTSASKKPALWLTERGGRLRPREIEERFAAYRDALGLDKELVPHCLRHSHVTHQIEDGADPTFVQNQVGHRYPSTTALYTGVSGDFMNTMMRKVLDRALNNGQ
ncbi:tyrosine-type recombinase/integrase [Streptomyces microflavus]|uniref:tyrosine-type recombinase/integrase n=1 Tax=Streptomyces TaxID=1883 RepID=UPI0005170BE6|nr:MULTISPECIES: tyrosine-type recombinase/integrase [Streptomyces]MDX2977405.1 tyrosine-type recombinase/integrase [Streptomyces sp. NRRL_B-2249]